MNEYLYTIRGGFDVNKEAVPKSHASDDAQDIIVGSKIVAHLQER
jgi:hypothetical protein